MTKLFVGKVSDQHDMEQLYLHAGKRFLQAEPHDSVRLHISAGEHLVRTFLRFPFNTRLQTGMLLVYAPSTVATQLGNLRADGKQAVHVNRLIVRRP